jgi:hypothetical protein
VAYRARAELRRRWGATLALTLLVGVVAGAVLTMVAGARRSSTAYERFRQETLAGDLDLTTSNPDPARFEELARLPEVVALAPTAFPFLIPQGSDLFPFLEFLVAVAPDGRFGVDLDRPRVVEGRMPDAGRADEMAVVEGFAAERDLEVGDRVVFESYAADQFEALFGGGEPEEPAGPVVTLRVTGVLRVPDFLGANSSSFNPQAFLSPAFYQEHQGTIGTYEGTSRLRLRNGQDDAPAVVEAVRRIWRDDPELELQLEREVSARIDDAFDVLVVALLLCAACAALAGTAAVGQALARHLAGSSPDQPTLAGLGLTRRQRLSALAVTAAPVVVGGALVAVAVAVAASPLMPVGVARRAEPDLGISVDLPVLGLGFVGVVVVVAGLALLGARPTSRAAAGDGAERSGRRRPSAVVRLVRATVRSPAAATGAGMALEPGRGRTAVPVRSALTGVVAGVVGLVAVVVFATSLGALVDASDRYGFPWHAMVSGFSGQGDALVAGLAADPRVADVGTVTYSLVRLGDEDVPIHGFEAAKGEVAPTLLEGRLPAAPDEVVLGTATLSAHDGDVGGTVEVVGPDGPVVLRVVGRAAFPVLDERSAVNRGAALTAEGLEPLAPPETFNRDVLVRWAAGVDPEAARGELAERTGTQVFPPRLPNEVGNLERVEALPRALAVLLAALAALALTHTLVTTTRRRRGDLAVLRTLGFVRPQVAAAVAWQATLLAVVGLLVGIPLGVAAGRVAWGVVADGIGVIDRPTVPLVVLAIVGGAALLAANLVAAVPALMAGATRPGTVLRTQ